MAQTLLAMEALPVDLRALIVTKAEGNPFFVEEVVKSLQESGAIRLSGDRYVLDRRFDDTVVPDTIQDVIMARIDRLSETPKKTLQLASVIGRDFTRRLLARIADARDRIDDALRELKAGELIYDFHKSGLPESAYIFKHALTHDVAYNSLLRERRKELHRLIALAIEELYSDRLAEHHAVLAYHFTHAEEWAKALAHLLDAAARAMKAFANREALDLYEQALDVASRAQADPQTVMAIHRARGELHFASGDFARTQEDGQRLLALAREAADRSSEAAALVSIGWASTYSHDFDRALQAARQATDVADQAGLHALSAHGRTVAGFVHLVTGRLDEGRTNVEAALSLTRIAGDVRAVSLALYAAGLLKNWEGAYREAVAVQNEGIRMARVNGLLSPLIRNLFVHGFTLTAMGEYDGALAALEEALPLAERVGNELYYYRVLNSLGRLYLDVGAVERATELNRRSAEGAHKRGDPETIANAELNLADASLLDGDLVAAGELLDGVHRLVRNPAISDWMKWRYSMHLFASLAELWLARDDPAKALAFVDHALEIAMRTSARKYLVTGWRLRGLIAPAQRDRDSARSALHESLMIASTIASPGQLWPSYVALGRFHQETGDSTLARQAYQAAWRVIEGLHTAVVAGELREALRNASFAREIRDLSGL